MHQRRVRAFAQRRGESVGGELLAGAGAGGLGGQRGFQRLGGQGNVLGEAVDQ
ncbi:hypothetical protein D9M71_179960 [compost metagenome]